MSEEQSVSAFREFLFQADKYAWLAVCCAVALLAMLGYYVITMRDAPATGFAFVLFGYTVAVWFISSLWALLWSSLRDDAEEREDLIEQDF